MALNAFCWHTLANLGRRGGDQKFFLICEVAHIFGRASGVLRNRKIQEEQTVQTQIVQTQIRVAIVVAFTAGMALVPVSAKALCQAELYADHSFSDGANAQVIGRTDAVADIVGDKAANGFTYAYTAETTNPVFANQIFAAVAGHNRLYIIGSAAACPATGQFRDMGNIIQLFQQP
jgi:hypothetical protein